MKNFSLVTFFVSESALVIEIILSDSISHENFTVFFAHPCAQAHKRVSRTKERSMRVREISFLYSTGISLLLIKKNVVFPFYLKWEYNIYSNMLCFCKIQNAHSECMNQASLKQHSVNKILTRNHSFVSYPAPANYI